MAERDSMEKTSIGSIVWGVREVARAVDFWVAALAYRVKYQDEGWAILLPQEGENGVQLSLNRVSSEKPRRHHMDLFCADMNREAERLIALGARRMAWDYPLDADYLVLLDTEGNSFCLVQK